MKSVGVMLLKSVLMSVKGMPALGLVYVVATMRGPRSVYVLTAKKCLFVHVVMNSCCIECLIIIATPSNAPSSV